MTLDDLIFQLQKWRRVVPGDTVVRCARPLGSVGGAFGKYSGGLTIFRIEAVERFHRRNDIAVVLGRISHDTVTED